MAIEAKITVMICKKKTNEVNWISHNIHIDNILKSANKEIAILRKFEYLPSRDNLATIYTSTRICICMKYGTGVDFTVIK